MVASENLGAQMNTPADLQRRIAELKEQRRLNGDLARNLIRGTLVIQ